MELNIYDLNPDHDGFIYDPIKGKLFRLVEVDITYLWEDGKTRSLRRKVNGVSRLCTHLIIFIQTGKWPKSGNVVDHRDGNGFNNKWTNLREATKQQNAFNKDSNGRWNNNNLGLEMGVTLTPLGKYRVRVNKVQIGVFETISSANKAAKEARVKHYGEFDFYQRPFVRRPL